MARYQDNCPLRPLLDSSTLARRAAAELLTLEYFEAVPGELPTDVYEQHHILLNVEDYAVRVETWRDGRHFDLPFQAHAVMVTPARLEVGFRWHTPSDVLVITLDPDKFQRFAEKEVGVLLTSDQLKDLPQIQDEELCRTAMMLCEALKGEELGSEVIFESLARVFLVRLIQRYGDPDETAFDAGGFTSRQYQKVFDFVAECYGHTITVEDMAREACLSPYHFSRVFKDVVGQTPHQFVTGYRVERARQRLAAPRAALSEIALACGFSDQSHLTRVFKQVLGLTPTAYRRGLGAAHESSKKSASTFKRFPSAAR